MSKLKKVFLHEIQDIVFGLMAAAIVGAIFYFVAIPILRNQIQKLGRPIPANIQDKVIQTNQP